MHDGAQAVRLGVRAVELVKNGLARLRERDVAADRLERLEARDVGEVGVEADFEFARDLLERPEARDAGERRVAEDLDKTADRRQRVEGVDGLQRLIIDDEELLINYAEDKFIEKSLNMEPPFFLSVNANSE